MTTALPSATLLDRFTTMGDLTGNVSRILQRFLMLITVALTLEILVLFYAGSPGALAFSLIAVGSVIALATWATSPRGLPLLPMIILQSLIIYGLPIASWHQNIVDYPKNDLNRAGLEILIFSLATVFSWKLAMQVMTPSRAHAYTLVGVDREGIGGLSRIGFGLVALSTLYLVLQSLGQTDFILELLPSGSYPVIFAAVSAASFCGFFLLALILGAGGMPYLARMAFWGLLIANCVISASGFLLSGASGVLASVAIGLFWSSGGIPWRFVILTAALVSFFNSGKYAMRERYWESAEQEVALPSGLTALPEIYTEWYQASTDAVFGGESDPASARGPANKKPKQQGLFERLNNLQNILYVIDAMDAGHIPALGGSTYTLIPPLLVPRILWPDKPRTHEGQVMLNVHFGRQDLQSTFKTYVARRF